MPCISFDAVRSCPLTICLRGRAFNSYNVGEGNDEGRGDFQVCGRHRVPLVFRRNAALARRVHRLECRRQVCFLTVFCATRARGGRGGGGCTTLSRAVFYRRIPSPSQSTPPLPSKTAFIRAHQILDDDKFVLATESCHCPGVERDPMKAWARGERTAHDMIADVNSWAAGW